MDDQNNHEQNQPEPIDRHEGYRGNRSGGWIGGAILIALGGFLLLQNLTGFHLNNWWALFILIPAVGAFGNAWNAYQNAGKRLTARVSSPLFGGVILTLVATMFLFNMNWTIFGPAMLILVGAGLLIRGAMPD